MNLLNQILQTPAYWSKNNGPESTIAVSSRVRLARNLEEHPFPQKLVPKQRALVTEKIATALPQETDALFIPLTSLDFPTRQILLERHLISKELANKEEGSAVYLNKEQSISVMINEEDHLRMQCILPGFQPENAAKTLNSLDNKLEDKLNWATNKKWGYLTTCPSNVGTGLRASVMLHLPALNLLEDGEQIPQMIEGLHRIGLEVRGNYGEGSKAIGNLFQISNQYTLGMSEDDIFILLRKAVKYIIQLEKNARITLLETQNTKLHDVVGRAYGVLKYAHLISVEEALQNLSLLRLGAELTLLPSSLLHNFQLFLLETKPAHLDYKNKTITTASESDALRAKFIAKHLKQATPNNPSPPNQAQ